MADYLLVHGAWHGGWCWRRVAPLLRDAGHGVFTPTLTGLGERAHLAHEEIDLNTHVQDVVAVLECEDLSGVILVGHSYAGMVISGAAERAADRIRRLVFLDAFVPRDGESLAGLVGPEATSRFQEKAWSEGEGWRLPPMPPERYGIVAADDIRWVGERLTSHPLKTWLQPVRLSSAVAARLPRAFLYCRQPPMGPFGAFAEGARQQGWCYRELETGHDAMITAPRELADLLLQLA